jgi:hypothetical protein
MQKENATLEQRIKILDWIHERKGVSQAAAAHHWDKIYLNLQLKQPTISNWVKNEAKWRLQWDQLQNTGRGGNIKRSKQTEHPTVMEMLELWVAKALQDNVALSGEII